MIDPKGGFIVSGNPYDGIVLPGNGVPSARGRPHSGAALRSVSPASTTACRTACRRRSGRSSSRGLEWRTRSRRRSALRAGFGSFANRTAINRDTALGGNPPFQLQETVVNGLVDFPAGATQRAFPFTQTIQDPVFKIPTAWEWNTTFQREVGWGTTVEVGYVGRRGLHNQRKRNLNQLLPGTVQANPTINANALRPYLGYGVVDISENSGRSRYNGLQVSVQHRFAAGLQFGLAYTLSRSRDDGSSLTDVLPNAFSDTGYYGLSDFDRTHVLVANYIYELPFFKGGQRRPAPRLLGGWEISGVNQFQSGVPLSVRTSADIAGVGPGSGNQFWNLTGDPFDRRSPPSPRRRTGSTRRRSPYPRTGTYGTQLRNTLRGPGFWAWDMSLRKNIQTFEKQSLQFRFELFDILNHPNWSNPVTDPTNGSFGKVTGKSNDDRQMQLALKYIF